MSRWIVYILLTASLAAAVFLNGGLVPSQWQWTALGVSVAACLAFLGSHANPGSNSIPQVFLTALLAWMLFQLVPLPPALVAFLSPLRWNAVQAARVATGQDARAWVAISTAPPATWESILNVVPAVATFLTVCRLGRWWPGRIWVVVAPVLAIAWLESVLGLLQFSAAYAASEVSGLRASGTYLNYDHYADLLGMAFPLAVMGAVSAWRRGTTHHVQPARTGVRASAMLLVAACLLMCVILSTSRMGVLATLAAMALTMLAILSGTRRRWRWLIAVVLPMVVLVSLSSRQLVMRFTSLTLLGDDFRVPLWADTLRVVAAYPWTGCGLGAFEHALYRFKTVTPVESVGFAHNDYLQILAELGLPGLLLFLALAGWIVRRTLTVVLFGRGSPNWELAVGILGAFLALGLHSLVDFNLYVPANALALAWLAGAAASLRPPRQSTQGAEIRFKFPDLRPIIASFALLIAVLSVVPDVLHASPGSVCRYSVCRFDQIEAAGDTSESIATLINADPANPMVWCAYAEGLSRRGDTQDAESAFGHAATLGPAMPAVLMRAANFDLAHSRRTHLLSVFPQILSRTGEFDQFLFSYLQSAEIPIPRLLGNIIPAAVRPARAWLAWLSKNGSDQDLTDTWMWMQHNGLLDDQSASATTWTLWNRGSYQTAHTLWSSWLGTNSLLANTRFEMAPRDTPFDWALDSVPAVVLTRMDGLEVRFLGTENLGFSGVRQFAVVPPGRYRFEAEIASENLTTDQGPCFHVFDCAKPDRINVATSSIQGTVARSWIGVSFNVPSGTESVAIQLERRPSQGFENRIEGTLRVYEVKLTPEGVRAEARRPQSGLLFGEKLPL